MFWTPAGWWLHNLSDVSIPMFDHPNGQKCCFLWSWSFLCCNLWSMSLVTASPHCWLIFKLLSAISPGPFLQGCSLASWSPACTYLWGCPAPGVGLCIYCCWFTSNISISPLLHLVKVTVNGSPVLPPTHQPFSPIWCHLQTLWGSVWFHHKGPALEVLMKCFLEGLCSVN